MTHSSFLFSPPPAAFSAAQKASATTFSAPPNPLPNPWRPLRRKDGALSDIAQKSPPHSQSSAQKRLKQAKELCPLPPSAAMRRKKPAPFSPAKTPLSPASLRRRLLEQRQQELVLYLKKALPPAYLFYAFGAATVFSSAQNISKNTYKFSPLGLVIHRPAARGEIFIFVALPGGKMPLAVSEEMKMLKTRGKMAFAVQGSADLAFHLKNLGIGLLAEPSLFA